MTMNLNLNLNLNLNMQRGLTCHALDSHEKHSTNTRATSPHSHTFFLGLLVFWPAMLDLRHVCAASPQHGTMPFAPGLTSRRDCTVSAVWRRRPAS